MTVASNSITCRRPVDSAAGCCSCNNQLRLAFKDVWLIFIFLQNRFHRVATTRRWTATVSLCLVLCIHLASIVAWLSTNTSFLFGVITSSSSVAEWRRFLFFHLISLLKEILSSSSSVWVCVCISLSLSLSLSLCVCVCAPSAAIFAAAGADIIAFLDLVNSADLPVVMSLRDSSEVSPKTFLLRWFFFFRIFIHFFFPTFVIYFIFFRRKCFVATRNANNVVVVVVEQQYNSALLFGLEKNFRKNKVQNYFAPIVLLSQEPGTFLLLLLSYVVVVVVVVCAVSSLSPTSFFFSFL